MVKFFLGGKNSLQVYQTNYILTLGKHISYYDLLFKKLTINVTKFNDFRITV